MGQTSRPRMRRVLQFFRDHFVSRTIGWWIVLALDFVFFVVSVIFFPLGVVVAIPTAWGVGYLLGISYTENRWRKALLTEEPDDLRRW